MNTTKHDSNNFALTVVLTHQKRCNYESLSN